MITEACFNGIRDKAMAFQYTSFGYLGYEDCENADTLSCDETLILLHDRSRSPALLHFAFHDFAVFGDAVAKIAGELQINFVPYGFKRRLDDMGFVTWAEFIDHFNLDLQATAAQLEQGGEMVLLKRGQGEQASQVSRQCARQSRGFTGETPQWFEGWLGENDVIIVKQKGVMVGFCCVSIYNGGTTLWIREIAVVPQCQGQGVGKKLMAQAICYGVNKGAQKGFLAADVQNTRAIGLYNQCGFFAKAADGELQMVRR